MRELWPEFTAFQEFFAKLTKASISGFRPLAWVGIVYQQFPQLVIDEFQVYNLVMYAA